MGIIIYIEYNAINKLQRCKKNTSYVMKVIVVTWESYKSKETTSCCIGYPSSHRGYKCYDIASRKILIYHHVVFDEMVFSFSKDSKCTPHEYDFLDDPNPYFFLHHSRPSSNINHLTQSYLPLSLTSLMAPHHPSINKLLPSHLKTLGLAQLTAR